MDFSIKQAIRFILVIIGGIFFISTGLFVTTNSRDNTETNANLIWNQQDVERSVYVFFDPGEGTTDSVMKEITFGKPYGELPTCYYDGYIFEGWFTSKEGGKQITADDAVNLINSHTLYAHYHVDEDILKRIEALEKAKYPVGYVFQSTSKENPEKQLGGKWQMIAENRILVGYDPDDADFSKVGMTGGEEEHVLTVKELPAHTHSGTVTQSETNHNHATGYNTTNNAEGHINMGLATSSTTGGWLTGGGYMGSGLVAISGGSNTTSSSGGHTHSFTTNSVGGNRAHNNMMPYYTVYTWEKISD